MNKGIIIAALVITTAVGATLFSTSAMARPGSPAEDCPMGERGPRSEHRMEMMAAVLDLSEGQKTQIAEILESEREAMRPLMEQMREGREALHAATMGASFDEARIRSLANQKSQVQVEMAVAKARTHSKIFALLTPEQQAKAKKLQPLMGKKGRHHGPADF